MNYEKEIMRQLSNPNLKGRTLYILNPRHVSQLNRFIEYGKRHLTKRDSLDRLVSLGGKLAASKFKLNVITDTQYGDLKECVQDAKYHSKSFKYGAFEGGPSSEHERAVTRYNVADRLLRNIGETPFVVCNV